MIAKDVPPQTAPFVVYKCYNANDVLIYVGATANIRARVGGHQHTNPWFRSEVARMDLIPFDTAKEAAIHEFRLIMSNNTKYNQGGTKWFAKVK